MSTLLPGWAEDLDVSSPGTLRQDITALKRANGRQRRLQLLLAGLDGVELPSVEVRAEQIDVDLLMEIVGSQLVARGELGVTWTGPCRRCLEPVRDRLVIEVHEIFDASPVEGETYPLEDEFVDLRPMVREALVLGLPVAPLCSESCAGPAPDRFPASTAEDRQVGQSDPRWAALNQLDFESDD